MQLATWLIIASLFTPVLLNAQLSYSYPSSIDKAVPAKWTYLNFTVCIFSIADAKYERLFIKAMDEWKNTWPHFSYSLGKSQNCNINVSITKDFVELTGAGHAGITKTGYYEDGNIVKADIIIPTQIKAEVSQGYYCCREVTLEFTEKMFYATALHEFGHALNLGHAVDDGEDPRDVMHPTASEESRYIISSLTIKALDKIYGTSTDAKDYPINFKPSVTFESTLDKASYVFDDRLKLSGKVSKIGGTGTILLFDPSFSLFTFTSFSPEKDGSFDIGIDLFTDKAGKWLLVVQYFGASQFFSFNVDEVPYEAYVHTDKAVYEVGDVVKITGNVTRAGKQIFLTLVNPQGISLASTIAQISPDKTFSAEFKLRESKLAVEGKWAIRAEYADSTIEGDVPTDTYFDVVKSLSLPVPEDDDKVEQLELRVQARQIKDLVILRVRNMGDSTVDVYTLNISLKDSLLNASRGPKQWDKESDINTATFSTLTDPIRPGYKQYFLLRISDIGFIIEWKAFSNDGNIFANGLVTPLVR